MRSAMRLVMIVVALLSTVSSCSMISQKIGIRSEGEMRLVRLVVPEIMDKDLPYPAELTFEADGQPEIKSVCFRWLNVVAPVKSPSLYCYTQEVQANLPIGSVCSRLTDEGIYNRMSELSCSKPKDVRYGMPGSFIVMLQAENVKPYYNALECRVEYVQDGQVKQTNKVTVPVMVRYQE
jgi:hypothetical protein